MDFFVIITAFNNIKVQKTIVNNFVYYNNFFF